MESTINSLFPHESFRPKQKKTIEAAIQNLYYDGYDNVVIDAPVGIGKSSICTTLLRYADDGFYSTPQKSLREQIQNDEALQEHISSLKARKDYTCKVTGNNCKDCSINQDSERSCSEMGQNCTYWASKLGSINSDIAVLTFSYLIIDNMLPEMSGDTPISFGNREMLVVDEAQSLEQQTASLHAGFKISPYSLPNTVFAGATNSADYEAESYEDVKQEVNTIYSRSDNYVPDIPEFEMSPAEKKCKRLVEKIDWMKDEIGRGNHWVVDVDSTKYNNNYTKVLELKPINVSTFLKNNVWNRASKRVISTATLPYRSNPEVWLRKVGLDPDNTAIISVGMQFPVENRPIHTDSTVCSMSGGGFDDNFIETMETLNDLAEDYYNEKGVVHTSSYSRARKIYDSASSKYPYLQDNLYLHEKEDNADEVIDDWQNGGGSKDILLSPSVMSGVDLKDDMCRFQILLKVPYPAMESRVKYITENQKFGWPSYFERAMIRVVQSYGRGIRSSDDKCDYFVLDEDFNDLLEKRQAPRWFLNALEVDERASRSVFDY
jgi:Rad3-related DNA helicase